MRLWIEEPRQNRTWKDKSRRRGQRKRTAFKVTATAQIWSLCAAAAATVCILTGRVVVAASLSFSSKSPSYRSEAARNPSMQRSEKLNAHGTKKKKLSTIRTSQLKAICAGQAAHSATVENTPCLEIHTQRRKRKRNNGLVVAKRMVGEPLGA